jgi:hypothetical protein
MRPSLLVPLGLLLASAGCDRPAEAPAPASPARVVEDFYTARIRSKLTGAPSAEELAQIAPFLSDTLRALLVAARQMRDADVARAPDEKPAFAEGDLFSSLFEGPTAFRIVTDSVAPSGRVPVRFTYADARDTTTWTDAVQVAQEQGRYVITDVQYGGKWDFANGGSLRTSLEQALAAPSPVTAPATAPAAAPAATPAVAPTRP